MTEISEPGPAPRKGLAKPLIIGVVAAAALGGGGWYATHSGLLSGGSAALRSAGDDVAFVPVPAMVISLGPESPHRHLRFSATLEVGRGMQAQASDLMPRVVDVLNSYLRAIDVSQFDEPAALFRLRAQMLRRVQLVTGQNVVRDLLVTEFVFN